jgi:hypothetical protein
MRSFSLFTTDSRYRVPTLTLIEAREDDEAIARARQALAASAFHTAVELREGDNRIYQEFKRLRAVLDNPPSPSR